MQHNAFGGDWTEDKLSRLRGYLVAYMHILKLRPQYTTHYVDAFAGTGNIRQGPQISTAELDGQEDDLDVENFLSGSVRVALEIPHPFAHYLFIEKNPKNVESLQKVRAEYPHLSDRIQIERADANEFIIEWCKRTNWRKNRAVVFLDPFGMQVRWELLETIAETRAIDLWLLVPLGIGVNRMLPSNDLPPQEWQDRLTDFFGNEDWKELFYSAPQQATLFGDGPSHEKVVNYEALKTYFLTRLKSIFGDGVAENPLTQRNSNNSPLFLLCFATANPYARAAIDIARSLLASRPRQRKSKG